MPRRETEYAKVEWAFLTFDERLADLDLPHRLVYICVWCMAVAMRQPTFKSSVFLARMVADLCHIPLLTATEGVENAIESGLLSRSKGGAVTVDGVRAKHSTLRGWPGTKGCPPVRSPKRTEQNGTERKGEEDSAEASDDASTPPPSPVVFTFDADLMRGTKSGPFHVTEDFHHKMQSAYPDLVLLTHYRLMGAWLVANRRKRKTHTGMPAFIQGWLARQQNRGGGTPAPAIDTGRDDGVL